MNRLSIVIALACAFSSPLAAQVEPSTPPEIPAADDTSLEENLKDLERDRGFARANDKVSRSALGEWAECLARKNRGEATRVLTMDFTSGEYARAMRMLTDEDKQCRSFRGTLRTGKLLLAGELAEALIELDRVPLETSLARAAAAPPTAGFSFTDKVAICVVRSVPSDVAALFATARDSAEENAALHGLATPMGMCARAIGTVRPLSVNPAGLRAMLATASLRSVAGLKEA